MTSSQRQAVFDRLFNELARKRAKRLGLVYAGTIRKLPPPPLPGERPGRTRYYLNAAAENSVAGGLVELGGTTDAALRKAEKWVETGEGRRPLS
jgi:hypothetical protein